MDEVFSSFPTPDDPHIECNDALWYQDINGIFFGVKRILAIIVFLISISLSSCNNGQEQSLKLATSTSTYDSGLLDILVPAFEDKFNVDVDIITVGTGQAIALGESRDVDIILVHARELEEQFIAEGHGTIRLDVMYNDFVIVGPISDPAGIVKLNSAETALAQIANTQSLFISRGDDSGTHLKEISLWKLAGVDIQSKLSWYQSVGQGMGDVLRFADETKGYTLSDRGTYLSLKEKLPNLVILFGGESIGGNPDTILFNPYSVIPVEPAEPGDSNQLALDFAYWITDLEAQEIIKDYLMGNPGWPLFYPNSTVWNNSQ